MCADSRRLSVAVAVTGASGAVYATRTLAALLAQGTRVELVVSDYGRRLLRDELGDRATIEGIMPFLSGKYGPAVHAGSLTVHSNRDLGATIASGSHGCGGMVIVPVLDENARRRGSRAEPQSRGASGRRHAQGTTATGDRPP